ISVLPGKRVGSVSSQSSPPHSVAVWPSPSASTQPIGSTQRAFSSSHTMEAAQGAGPLTQLPFSQRSAPLQKTPSSQALGQPPPPPSSPEPASTLATGPPHAAIRRAPTHATRSSLTFIISAPSS